MLVPVLQSESLSKMTSGSKVDYPRVYEALCECAREMLVKYNQKQMLTKQLEVKIRAASILFRELKKTSEKPVTTCETVLFALKSHAEALQGHEHLLSKKGNTYALLEQTRALRERHGEAPASLLRYHDLKDNSLEAGIPLNPDLKEAMSSSTENKTLTLQALENMDNKKCPKHLKSKRTPSDQTDSEKKQRKINAQTHPQGITASQESEMEYQEAGYKAIGFTAELKALAQMKALEDALGLNGKESETVHRLFNILNSKKIRPEKDFHTLLCRHVNRNCLHLFCMKALVFFHALTNNVKHTGCLTDMLHNKKEHIQDFITRKDSELEYLAGLNIFRSLSHMNHGRGLPRKELVEAMLGWQIWKPEGVFSMDLFLALASMNHGRGLPRKELVEAMLDWQIWKPEGVFSMDLFLALASMNHGRGLPRKELVEAMLDWRIWKPEGVFSMELFLAFASMNFGKGLPIGNGAVEEVRIMLESMKG